MDDHQIDRDRWCIFHFWRHKIGIQKMISIWCVGNVDTLFFQIQAQQVAPRRLALAELSVRRATPRFWRDLICAGTTGTAGIYQYTTHYAGWSVRYLMKNGRMLRSISLNGKAIYHVNSHLCVFYGEQPINRISKEARPAAVSTGVRVGGRELLSYCPRSKTGFPRIALKSFRFRRRSAVFFKSCWASSEPPVRGESTQGQCRAGWLLESLPENLNVCSTAASIRCPSVVPPEL